MDSAGSRSDWTLGTASLVAGVGMVTLAIFPLVLPIVALTIVATLPLAAPLVAVSVVAALLTGAWLGARAAGRGIRGLGGGAAGGIATAQPRRLPPPSSSRVSATREPTSSLR